ncbi:MAG: beta-ketoacyl-ACP synthase [Pseudomonadales bacterium]
MTTDSRHRVVVTGAGNLTALGNDWPTFRAALAAGRSAVKRMPGWDQVVALNCALGAPLDLELPPSYTRKVLRSMGRTAQLGTRATELALQDAGLVDNPVITSGRTGLAYGSATGSPDALLEFVSTLTSDDARALKATSYIRGMSHTAAVNIAVHFHVRGRLLTTSSACTASSQAIGFGYETIRYGLQDVMIVGGADELTVAHSGVFDALFATSRKTMPTSTPRPFDRDRDGLVLGEGASTLILESLTHACERNATILAEVVGFATNTDGAHITQPDQDTQARCLSMALASAGLTSADIGYVSAHGTATDTGDVSESWATHRTLGPVPVSSLKGHLGHTLGACGGIEAWAAIMMLREGWFAPTLNLANPDTACAPLDYLTGAGREIRTDCVMSNNFAFGGINTSLIFRRWEA